MRKQKLHKAKCVRLMFMALFSVLILAGQGYALTFSTSDNIADNTLMSNDVLNGTFNITSQIPVNSQYNSPYSITSAYVTFVFEDDLDEYSYHYVDTLYSYTGILDYYMKYHYTYKSDAAESVTLDIAGQTATQNTEYFEVSQFDYQNYDGCYQTLHWFTQYYTVENGYKGAITIVQSLDAAALNDLADDGEINFDLTAYGDLYYKSGFLTVEIDANPQSSVPEPASILLLGLGLLGVIGTRKRMRH